MTTSPPRFNWRLWGLLWGLGVFGLVAILPYVLTLQASQLQKLPKVLPLPVLIALQLVQGIIILGVLIGLGLLLGRRIGLGAPILEGWLAGEPVKERVRPLLVPSLLFGLLSGAAVVLLDAFLFAPRLAEDVKRLGLQLPANMNPAAWKGLLASFYGGIDEEAQLRLFLLTLLAWLGWRLNPARGEQPSRAVLWGANLIAAILFGLGHLPATKAIGLPLDALVVTRAIVLNGLVGLGCGWLFFTYGLEGAMLAHFCADLVLHVFFPLLGGH